MVQPSTAAVNLTLSAFAAERRAAAACCGVVIGAERRRLLSIKYLLLAGRPAATTPHASAAVD